jgi:STE24 endopeptidase
VTPRRAARGALLAALLGAWIVAAILLWRSRLPGDLSLPDVDVDALFTPDELRRAERFDGVLRIETVLGLLATIAVLALYAWRGDRLMRESAAGRIGTGMLLGMMGLAFLWIAGLPFAIFEVWWLRRYDVAEIGYIEAIFGGWFALGAAFLFISLALLIVMGLAGRMRHWWIAGAPVFVALAALFAFVYPYLVVEDEPLRDPELEADVRAYSRAQGMDPPPVRVERVNEDTDAPNAYATGFGPSKHVFLWDTLTEGDFTTDEVRVVLAHELAHLSREHILRSLGWYTLFAFPGAYLIAVVTRRRGGMARPEAVPLSLLVLVVLQVAALPLQNAISRHLEAEADWIALETTRKPEAARTLFAKFTRETLAEPDPPRWAVLLLDSHPTVADRIAMAQAWKSRAEPMVP